MGRTHKLNDDIQKIITSSIENGMTLERSCQLAGIAYNSYRNWIALGEKEKQRIEQEIKKKLELFNNKNNNIDTIEDNQNNTKKITNDNTELLNNTLDTLNNNKNLINNHERANLAIQQAEIVDSLIEELKPNKFFKFLQGVKTAEAKFISDSLKLIDKAAKGEIVNITKKKKVINADGEEVITVEDNQTLIKGQWQAKAWMLERKFPKEFALSLKHDGNISRQETNHIHLHKHKEIDKSDERAANILKILIECGYLNTEVTKLIEEKANLKGYNLSEAK